MDVDGEYQQSSTITCEWTVRGLKNLFESTKGDTKSKATKSAKFDEGRWQILFYPNSGSIKDKDGAVTDGGFISLYLSCEPTAEEKEAAISDGRNVWWTREGIYKFTFEIRNLAKTMSFTTKEAPSHSFSYKTVNWGWAQFARRDHVFNNSAAVKMHDAFVIICTITSSPIKPKPPSPCPRRSVPMHLLEAIGDLLDDATYSDIEFILPRKNQSLNEAKRICAAKRLLVDAGYFADMFSSGFKEGSESPHENVVEGTISETLAHEIEDSDAEDEAELEMNADTEKHPNPTSSQVDVSTPKGSSSEPTTGDIEMDESTASLSATVFSHSRDPSEESQLLAPKKQTVIIRDVAYNTFRAVLYYLYTDIIVFAPLSSSFSTVRCESSVVSGSNSSQTSQEGGVKGSLYPSAKTRKEWIAQYVQNNTVGLPAPCSAKAAYQFADRLGLEELKSRAAQHIIKSLTVENIAYEVFSPFAATFESIRKVQVQFFLDNWVTIRSSDSMRNVWHQIRSGRHPGFEEVWPVIVQNLEFNPDAMKITENDTS